MSKNQQGHQCGLLSFGFSGFPSSPISKKSILLFFPLLVGVAGFEPATLRLSSACSNQLSYTPGLQILRSSG